MGYLEDNLKALEFRPNLYKIVKEKIDNDEYDCSYIEEIEARDGNKVLCIDDKGKKVRLNSLYRPIQEAEKWADQFNFNNINVSVIMFGMGNGIFVREIIRRLKKDCIFFLSEPDFGVFMHNMKNQDMTDILLNAAIKIYIGDINDDDLSDDIQGNLHWSMLPTQIVCSHPVYDKLYIEKYHDFLVGVKKADSLEQTNRDTGAYMSHQSVKNILRNMHFIKESNYISEFIGDIPDDVPAIIVSAGPSLDKNIDELKRAEGKAFILATDTSVKYLLAHDIKYDAAITLDPKKWPKHMEDPRCLERPIFCALEGQNKILEANKGRKIWFRGTYFMGGLYEKHGKRFPSYNVGGSVATAAYNVCAALKFKRIVLIGQDLAYSGDVTHAGGVKKSVPLENKGIEFVDAIDGGKIRSRYDWIIYRDWFESSIKILKNIETIDATEGGALIHGSKVMTLSEVIDKYCNTEFLFSKLLEEKTYTFGKEEYEEVRKDILHLEREFKNIKEKSEEGKEAVESLNKMVKSGKRNQKKEDKYLKVIKKANNFIGKQPANELLDEYISEKVTDKMQTINCLTDDEDQNMLDTLEVTGVVYDALIESVGELKEDLDNMLASV